MTCDRFPWVKWTAGPGRGPGANRNHGAQLAQGEWLIFVDDDCLPIESLVTSYIEAIQAVSTHPPVAFEGPTIPTHTSQSLLWEAPNNPDGGGYPSANFAIRRSDFIASGEFDERYRTAFEDIEFFNRFKQRGGSIQFVKNAAVYHPLRRIPKASVLANRWESRVIYSLDQGASAWTVGWRLPWHVTCVIQSRFRGQRWNFENLHAAGIFLLEWLHVVVSTPVWIVKWSSQPRGIFWPEHVRKNGHVPNYGF